MKLMLRWVGVLAVLAVALAVALWPRSHPLTAPPPLAAQQAQPARSGAERQPELDQLRARAALQACPAKGSPATPARWVLSGVVLPCLGQPGSVDLGMALAGRPALLNLWGPQCQPCREELPALAAYAQEPGAIMVLGVEVQQLPQAALELLAALNVHYPSVSDPDGRLRAVLGAPPVLPLSYVVSPDGRVSQVTPPQVLRSPAQVRAVIARYLGPGAAG